jgi:nucleoside-diphosphate-sugar epimerase
MPKQKVLVLGASGFIGSAMLAELMQQADRFEVTVLEHKKPTAHHAGKVIKISGDLLRTDWSFLKGNPPDIVFHFARIHSTRYKAAGRYLAAIKGYFANVRLLRALRELPQPIKLVYVSGSLMYGEGEGKTESAPLSPVSFARQYKIAEWPFLKANPENNVQITLARVPWVLGFGSWFKAFYHDQIRKLNKVPSYSSENVKMNFIDLEDCVKALMMIPFLPFKPVVNLFLKEPVAYGEFIGILSEAYRVKEIQQFTKEELTRYYEKALVEAFTLPVILGTQYPEMVEAFNYRYSDTAAMLRDKLLSFSKYE